MKNKNLVLGLALLTFTTFSCKEKKNNANDEAEKAKIETEEKVSVEKTDVKKYAKTHDTGKYSVTFESDNDELSTLKITTKGLEKEENDSLKIEGKILETYMTDLNADGVKEFFITVNPTDDSGNIDLIGIASNNGKSFSDIVINEPEELRDVNSDKLNIESKAITREFKSNGKVLKYNYSLTEGEAGYVLTAKKQ